MHGPPSCGSAARRRRNTLKGVKHLCLKNGSSLGQILVRQSTRTVEPRSKEIVPTWDHTVRLCPGPCGGPRGVGVSYERGTSVGGSGSRRVPGPRHVLFLRAGPLPSEEGTPWTVLGTLT